jgi:uncharacterized protein YuzE
MKTVPMPTTPTCSTREVVAACKAMALNFLRLSTPYLWLDYDQKADVLYVSFRKPRRAPRTIEWDEDVLIRKNGRMLVGVTILNASTKSGRTRSNAATRRPTESERN